MDLSTPKKPNFLSKFFDYTIDSSVSPTPLKNEQSQTINKNQNFSQAKTSQKQYTQNSQNFRKSPKNNQSDSQEHNMFSLSSQQQQQSKFSQQQNFDDNNNNQQSILNQQNSLQIPVHFKTINKSQQNYDYQQKDINFQDTKIKIPQENPKNFNNQDYNKGPQNLSQNQKDTENPNLLYHISDKQEKCSSNSNSLNISEISDFINDQNLEKQQNQQEKINLDQNSIKAQPSQNQVQILHQENQLNSIKFQAFNQNAENFHKIEKLRFARNESQDLKFFDDLYIGQKINDKNNQINNKQSFNLMDDLFLSQKLKKNNTNGNQNYLNSQKLIQDDQEFKNNNLEQKADQKQKSHIENQQDKKYLDDLQINYNSSQKKMFLQSTPNLSDNFIDFSEIKSANNQESGKKSKKGGNYKELMDFQELVDLEQERKIYQINESDSFTIQENHMINQQTNNHPTFGNESNSQMEKQLNNQNNEDQEKNIIPLSFEKTEKIEQKNIFEKITQNVGFKTANNKQINFDENQLKKNKFLENFEDLSQDSTDSHHKQGPNNCEYQNKIQDNQNQIQPKQNQIQDMEIEQIEKNHQLQQYNQNQIQQFSNGFSTAKSIVPQKQLQLTENENNIQQLSEKEIFIGFKNAQNQQIIKTKINPEKLNNFYKNLELSFEDEEDEINLNDQEQEQNGQFNDDFQDQENNKNKQNYNQIIEQKETNHQQKFLGFQNAKNDKKLEYNFQPKNMKNNLNLEMDNDDQQKIVECNQQFQNQKQQNNNNNDSGFQNANCINNQINKNKDEKNEEQEDQNGFCQGFKTAKNQKIKINVSNNKFLKTLELSDSDSNKEKEDEQNYINNHQQKEDQKAKFEGFQKPKLNENEKQTNNQQQEKMEEEVNIKQKKNKINGDFGFQGFKNGKQQKIDINLKNKNFLQTLELSDNESEDIENKEKAENQDLNQHFNQKQKQDKQEEFLGFCIPATKKNQEKKLQLPKNQKVNKFLTTLEFEDSDDEKEIEEKKENQRVNLTEMTDEIAQNQQFSGFQNVKSKVNQKNKNDQQNEVEGGFFIQAKNNKKLTANIKNEKLSKFLKDFEDLGEDEEQNQIDDKINFQNCNGFSKANGIENQIQKQENDQNIQNKSKKFLDFSDEEEDQGNKITKKKQNLQNNDVETGFQMGNQKTKLTIKNPKNLSFLKDFEDLSEEENDEDQKEKIEIQEYSKFQNASENSKDPKAVNQKVKETEQTNKIQQNFKVPVINDAKLQKATKNNNNNNNNNNQNLTNKPKQKQENQKKTRPRPFKPVTIKSKEKNEDQKLKLAKNKAEQINNNNFQNMAFNFTQTLSQAQNNDFIYNNNNDNQNNQDNELLYSENDSQSILSPTSSKVFSKSCISSNQSSLNKNTFFSLNNSSQKKFKAKDDLSVIYEDQNNTTPIKNFNKSGILNQSSEKKRKRFNIPKQIDSGKKSASSVFSTASQHTNKRNFDQFQEANEKFYQLHKKQKKIMKKKVDLTSNKYILMFLDNSILKLKQAINNQKQQKILEQKLNQDNQNSHNNNNNNQNLIQQFLHQSQTEQPPEIKLLNLKDLKIKYKQIQMQNITQQITFTEALNYKLPCVCVNNLISQQSQGQVNLGLDYFYQKSASQECLCKEKLQYGYQEIFEKLLQKDKNLTIDWVQRNYQQVVWKLSNYQNNIINPPLNKTLKTYTVYDEIEYRLYKENGLNEISIIKQILDQDEKLSRYMVLMITRIWGLDRYSKFIIIELTDGHYPIYAVIFIENSVTKKDECDFYSEGQKLLLQLYEKGLLKPGLKLNCFNLKECGMKSIKEAIQLEYKIPEKLVVQLEYNSISRAPYYKKLGAQKSRFFIRSLASIRPKGGLISMVDVFVIKRMPLHESMYQQCKKQERKLYIQNIDEDTPQQQKYFHCILQVQDAIIYYDSGYIEKKESRNLYCEIDLICITEDFYEEVKPGERLIIQGLKTTSQEFRAKYDHEKEEFNKKCLFLQTIPNQSKILLYKNQAKKEEISEIKAFGQKLVDQMPLYTFTDFQQNQALMDKLITNKIQDKKINRIECDVIFYTVKIEQKCIFGITENYVAICIKVHNDQYFGKKLHAFKPKQIQYGKRSKNKEIIEQIEEDSEETLEGQIGVFQNLKLENVHYQHARDQQFMQALFTTSENTDVSVNKSKYSKHSEIIDEIKEIKEQPTQKFMQMVRWLQKDV